MDNIITNKYEKNIGVMKEFQRFALFCRLPFRLISALYLIFIADGVFLLFSAGKPRLLIYELVIVAIVVFFCFAMYAYQTKVIKNQLDILGGGKPILSEYIFLDGCIETKESTGEQLNIGYDRIKGIKKTKNLILLSLGRSAYLILKKDSFEGCTQKEFIDFIREKTRAT